MQMDFKSILGENCKTGELLKEHTTFKVGGECDYFLTPVTEEELSRCMDIIKKGNLKYYIFGKGSNILADDKGYDGVIISTVCLNNSITHEGNIIEAGAGLGLDKISDYAMEQSLSGFEFACGIPGSLGGSIVMNAGAYGGEMKNIVKSVRLMNIEGQIVEFTNEEMNFGYRHSRLTDESWIAISALISLEKGDYAEIKARMEDLALQRRTKQPLEYPSAGSTFKRPTGYFAGKLIQDSNLKGVSIGGAQVSSKHSGFVINYNKASAKDIVDLIEHIKKTVFECQGVHLEEEVKILGEDEE